MNPTKNPTSVTDMLPRPAWHFRDQDHQPRELPLLMGIVNVTPDSFSDGGSFTDPQRAIDHALQLAADGANILDLGGESTRPGALAVPVDEELRRVVPVIERLRQQTDRLISVDTTKAEVARQSLQVGADIVNDISGLTFDSEMPSVCADTGCGVIAMHIQGTPQTMQNDPQYDDVVASVCRFLSDRLRFLEEAGIPRERIVLDPGIGFGKTARHNIDLLSRIPDLKALGRPVLIGHSRKRFLAKVLGRPVDERTSGTIGVSLAVAALGADIIRIHDVRETRDALLAWHTILRGLTVPE